jgi:hypothetical protein
VNIPRLQELLDQRAHVPNVKGLGADMNAGDLLQVDRPAA